MIIAFLPASVWAEDPGEKIVYMSKNGAGMEDGSSADNAKEISKINELSGDVIIKVVGEVTLPTTMPEANITFTRAENNENAVVATSGYISFRGNTTFDQIKYYRGNFTQMFADGHNLTFTETVTDVSNTANNLTIFGGGNKTPITGNPRIVIKTSLVGASVFGGGWSADLTGNPTIDIEGATLGNVYGGGYASLGNANVTGNPTIILKNTHTTGKNCLNGGGHIFYAGLSANVTGKVTINADTFSMNTSEKLYLGSRTTHADSQANIGSIKAVFKNSSLGEVYAGSYCDPNKSIAEAEIETVELTLSDTKVNQTVYAGGSAEKGSAKVRRSNLIFERSSATKIYGSGYGIGAGVETSSITAKNIDDVTFFAGGYGYNQYATVDNCEINVENAGSKGKAYNMIINGGSGFSPEGYLDNKVENLTLNFSGSNTIKTIRMVKNINLQEDAVLTQLSAENVLLNNIDLNDRLTVQKGASLVLKGSNQIKGDFNTAGNLTNVHDGLLLVGGKVISSDTASYTSTDFPATYEGGHPFLAAKADNALDVAKFISTDDRFFVANRASDEEGFKTEGAAREWYLDAMTYTVTFEENGGTEVQDLKNLLKGSLIPEPSTTKAGYTLIGWYKDAAFENQWKFSEDTVESDMTLYAKWNQNPYTPPSVNPPKPTDPLQPIEPSDPIDIPDPADPMTPSVPSAPTEPGDPIADVDNPKTGDNRELLLWLGLLLISVAALTGVVLYSRKTTNR